jgi:hypothetical protein
VLAIVLAGTDILAVGGKADCATSNPVIATGAKRKLAMTKPKSIFFILLFYYF